MIDTNFSDKKDDTIALQIAYFDNFISILTPHRYRSSKYALEFSADSKIKGHGCSVNNEKYLITTKETCFKIFNIIEEFKEKIDSLDNQPTQMKMFED